MESEKLSVSLCPDTKLNVSLKDIEKLLSLLELNDNSSHVCSDRDDLYNSEIVLDIVINCTRHMDDMWKKVNGGCLSSVERNSLFCELLKLVKTLTKLYKQIGTVSEEVFASATASLSMQILSVISYHTVPLDIRNSCGLLIAYIQLSENKYHNKYQRIREILKREGIFKDIEDIGQLAVFHGSLCCLSAQELFETITTENDVEIDMGSEMLQRLTGLVLDNRSHDGNLIILCSRILNHIILRLNEYAIGLHHEMLPHNFYEKYALSSMLSKNILDMIWFLWDHFQDSAKHLARESFIIFIKFQETVSHIDAISYFEDVGLKLLTDIPHKKHAFHALSYLIPLIGVRVLLNTDPELPSKLVQFLGDSSYATHSASLLESLFTNHAKEVTDIVWRKLWFSSFFKKFSKEMLTYGYENLLEKLLSNKDIICSALAELTISNDISSNQLCLLLITTKIAQKQSPKRDLSNYDFQEGFEYMWKDIMPFRYILMALNSFDPTVRTLAFILVNDSSKSTELYCQQELDAIAAYIENNASNQDAAFRQKYINSIKKLFNRINKGVATNIKKKIMLHQESSENNQSLLQIHENFICNLFTSMVNNLYCGANFPRRYTSLIILELIFDILLNRCSKPAASYCYLFDKLCNSSFIDTLLLCECDSYENIKKIAYKLLRIIARESSIDFSAVGDSLLNSIWILSSSTRPLDSVTSSYVLISLILCKHSKKLLECHSESNKTIVLSLCWIILKKLQKEIEVAKISLFRAASTAPMYGLILSLKNLLVNTDWEQFADNQTLWSDFLAEAIQACLTVAQLVSPIVKNSSPEGHLPCDFSFDNEDIVQVLSNSVAAQEIGFKDITQYDNLSEDELTKTMAVSAQMVLLCGWRSVKEVSFLLGLIVENFVPKDGIITYEQIENIGSLFLNLLIETKHRGAFEQAYVGYLMICTTLWESKHCRLNTLPVKWLNETLSAIQDTNDSRLCATRRSAGVPFIVQAILSTEPNVSGGSTVKSAFKTLLRLGLSDENLEAKLHAYNILRALYRETRLGEAVMPYTAEGIIIAINGYKNGSWKVRNSATLLFSALVTRMLGVKRSQDDLHCKNAVSALIFFKRYPQLYDFFLENLKTITIDMKDGNLASAAYPILLFLARFAIASHEGYASSVTFAPFVPIVLSFSSSPVYQLRSLAAKALIPLLSPPDIAVTVKQLCQEMSSKNQNQIHGNLICLYEVIKSYAKVLLSSADKKLLSDSLLSVLWVAREANTCFVTRATALKLFADPSVYDLISSHQPVLKQLTASCFSLILTLNQNIIHKPGAFYAVEAATELYLKINYDKDGDAASLSSLVDLMDHPAHHVRKTILEFIFSFKSVPTDIIKKIVIDIEKQDSDVDCKRLQFDLLYSFLNNLHREDDTWNIKWLIELLEILLQRWKHERREDYLSSMIRSSGEIIRIFLQEKYYEGREELITIWAEDVTAFSCIENSSNVRTSATTALSTVIANWRRELGKLENAELVILRAVLELFTDDDPNIRNTVTRATLSYLQQQNPSSSSQSFTACDTLILVSLEETLNRLFFNLASRKGNYISLLIQHSLREDQIEEFGLSQVKEDDRAFEKGETKVYREDIQIAKDVSKAIKLALSLSPSITESVRFNIDMISEYLLLPIPDTLLPCEQGDKGNPTSCICDIVTFLYILKREIEYVLSQFSILNCKDIFAFKHFDVWIPRLGCRALLWSALKDFAKELSVEIDSQCIDNIRCSLMKPNIFVNIIDWLS